MNTQITTSDFFAQTKKAFRSCKFAAANLEEVAGMRNVWGDFSNSRQAARAGIMWMNAFKKFSPKFEARLEGKNFRVIVTF